MPTRACVTNQANAIDFDSSVLIRRICTHPFSLCNSFSQIFLTTQGQFGMSLRFHARFQVRDRAHSREVKATRAPRSAMLQ
jgi:hypothetical protein